MNQLVPGLNKEIFRETIVDWPGLVLDSGQVNMLDEFLSNQSLPILPYDPISCSAGAPSCFETAAAHQASIGDAWFVTAPYTNPECVDQYIYEVDLNNYASDDLWLSNLWAAGDLSTQALCEDAKASVHVWRQSTDGSWNAWETGFETEGVWGGGQCDVLHRGRLPPLPENPATERRNDTNGFASHWVDVSDTKKVRVSVVAGSECEQRRLASEVLGPTP